MTNSSVGAPQYPVLSPAHPPQMQPPKPRRGLAITALILGILAMLIAVVPVLGAVLGIVSIILAAIALKKRQPKGLSVTGLVLGIVATIISAVMTFALLLAGSLFGAAFESLEANGGEIVFDDSLEVTDATGEDEAGDLAGGTALGSFERVPWDAFDVADAPASTRGGTEEDPHAIGTRFTVEDKWEVVVNMVDRDAEEHFLALMSDGSPAAEGERYVLVNMTVKNLSAEPKELQTLSVYYDIPGKLVSSGRPGTPSPDPVLFSEGMQITGNYTGYLAYLIEDTEGSLLRFTEWMTTKPIFVAVE